MTAFQTLTSSFNQNPKLTLIGSVRFVVGMKNGRGCCIRAQQDKGRPLPKFGEWDVNDPASSEGFTVIFNKARNEKKTGGKPSSPDNNNAKSKHAAVQLGKPPSKKRFCCIQ